jgi:hypothetical protein
MYRGPRAFPPSATWVLTVPSHLLVTTGDVVLLHDQNLAHTYHSMWKIMWQPMNKSALDARCLANIRVCVKYVLLVVVCVHVCPLLNKNMNI